VQLNVLAACGWLDDWRCGIAVVDQLEYGWLEMSGAWNGLTCVVELALAQAWWNCAVLAAIYEP